MMHTSKVIQREKARLRRQAGLPTVPEREKDSRRGRQRELAHQFHQDDGNAIQFLTETKRQWLLKRGGMGGEDGRLLCQHHNSEQPSIDP
jgi:hypothetical protein